MDNSTVLADLADVAITFQSRPVGVEAESMAGSQ
jgi:hypothetical protein